MARKTGAADGFMFGAIIGGLTGMSSAESIGSVKEATKALPQAPKSIAGKITGYTKHGINSAISHDGHGIKPSTILDIVKNPTKVIRQSGGRIKYMSSKGAVILNEYGKVITTYAKSSKYWR